MNQAIETGVLHCTRTVNLYFWHGIAGQGMGNSLSALWPFFLPKNDGGDRMERKPRRGHVSFRTSESQQRKIDSLAEKAGLNASELLRLVVDRLEDVQPGGWSVIWAGQDNKQGEGAAAKLPHPHTPGDRPP